MGLYRHRSTPSSMNITTLASCTRFRRLLAPAFYTFTHYTSNNLLVLGNHEVG